MSITSLATNNGYPTKGVSCCYSLRWIEEDDLLLMLAWMDKRESSAEQLSQHNMILHLQ